MARALEITLGSRFREGIQVFINTFPRSYAAYRVGPTDFQPALYIYTQTIADNVDAIYRIAARGIHSHLHLYNIHANQSADEYKIIYHLGRAIEKHLVNAGAPDLAQVHMFSVIGLLDYRLQTLGIHKPKLLTDMTKLIRLNKFDSEMGQTGGYMVYKCVSTTPLSPPKAA